MPKCRLRTRLPLTARFLIVTRLFFFSFLCSPAYFANLHFCFFYLQAFCLHHAWVALFQQQRQRTIFLSLSSWAFIYRFKRKIFTAHIRVRWVNRWSANLSRLISGALAGGIGVGHGVEGCWCCWLVAAALTAVDIDKWRCRMGEPKRFGDGY